MIFFLAIRTRHDLFSCFADEAQYLEWHKNTSKDTIFSYHPQIVPNFVISNTCVFGQATVGHDSHFKEIQGYNSHFNLDHDEKVWSCQAGIWFLFFHETTLKLPLSCQHFLYLFHARSVKRKQLYIYVCKYTMHGNSFSKCELLRMQKHTKKRVMLHHDHSSGSTKN